MNLDQFQLFADHKITLMEASKDDSGIDDCYMTDSKIEVTDFDMVKRHYANALHCSEECAASVDALLSVDDTVTFIEFKNGKVNNRNVKDKLRDSLLIFLDVTGKTISYTRENAELIVVYNPDKNGSRSKQSDVDMSSGKSRIDIGKHFMKKAKEELVLFDIGKYAPIYYKNMHTYSMEEFETYLQGLRTLGAVLC